MILIECFSAGLRVTLIARRVTVSMVMFQKPVLGSDLWECYAETPIKAGERVRVVKIEGHFIKVEAAK